jgi:hypothetical protein
MLNVQVNAISDLIDKHKINIKRVGFFSNTFLCIEYMYI